MAGYDRKRRALRILFEAGFFAAFQILFQVIWPDGAKLGRLWYLWYLGFGAIGGLIFALLFETVLFKLIFPYTLAVSDDCITTIHPSYERSVRKDELKSVAELNANAFRAAGFRISKYGVLGTWLWGCILIPKALPEYESVRDLALRWKGCTS